MAKNNIKTLRLSDEILEMIESQAGETFTAKFEALVTRCMWELPKKEQELRDINEQIDYQRKKTRTDQETDRTTRSQHNPNGEHSTEIHNPDKPVNKESG